MGHVLGRVRRLEHHPQVRAVDAVHRVARLVDRQKVADAGSDALPTDGVGDAAEWRQIGRRGGD